MLLRPLLRITVVGWLWAGFVADPMPAPPTPPPAPAPTPDPAPAPAPQPATWLATDGLWHGRDRSGVEWSHPDRATLVAYLSQ